MNKKRKRRAAPKTVDCKCGTRYIAKQLIDNPQITHCRTCGERLNRQALLKEHLKNKPAKLYCAHCGRGYLKSLLQTQGIIYCTNKSCISTGPIIEIIKFAASEKSVLNAQAAQAVSDAK